MTNLLQDGVTWLGGKLKDHAGLTITYARGVYSVSMTATCSMQEYQITDEEGFSTAVLSRDYILHGAELILNGAAVIPRAGDTITETIGGVAKVFEVLPISGLKEYEPIDPDATLLKIHTKQIG